MPSSRGPVAVCVACWMALSETTATAGRGQTIQQHKTYYDQHIIPVNCLKQQRIAIGEPYKVRLARNVQSCNKIALKTRRGDMIFKLYSNRFQVCERVLTSAEKAVPPGVTLLVAL